MEKAKIRIEVEITRCKDCPCCHDEREYGYCCSALEWPAGIGMNEEEIYEKCPFRVDK